MPTRFSFAALLAVSLLAAAPSALAAGEPAPGALAQAPAADVRQSVVKIHTKSREPDFIKPWTKREAQESTGTGAVVSWEGRTLILTNAHVVSYATQVDVQGYQQADKIPAKVVAFAKEMDLALVEIKDKAQADAFFKDRPPIPLADGLPAVKDAVNAYGYPLGGEELSVTRGIVSRVEVANYNLGAIGLRVQVDAAVNPGNSGGPVIVDGKVAGVVFSGIPSAQNIGYVIPITEVKTFLAHSKSGTYQPKWRLAGDPDLQTLENKALRAKLGLAPGQGGIMVDPAGNPVKMAPFKPWDVICAIGDHKVDDEGNATIAPNLRGGFAYFVDELAQSGKGAIPVTVLREGKEVKLDVPVTRNRAMLAPRLAPTNAYPRYFIHGPLCFGQGTEELAGFLLGKGGPQFTLSGNPLISRFMDAPAKEGEEIVIVTSPTFDHPIAKGYGQVIFRAVDSVNDVKITSLRQMATVLRDLKDPFVTIKFHDRHGAETLVFKREEMAGSTKQILEDNGIRYRASADLRDLFKDEGDE